MIARPLFKVLAVVSLALALPACSADSGAEAGTDADADRAVIDQLKTVGSDLSKPHAIDFYLYLPNREAAERAGARVRQLELAVEVEPAVKVEATDSADEWLVHAKKTMLVKESELGRIGKQLTEIAVAEGGKYDGWGAEVVQ